MSKDNPSASSIQWVELPETSDWYQELIRDEEGFEQLAEILKDVAGIHLTPSEKNRSLMAGRMSSLLKKRGLTTYSEYLKFLTSPLMNEAKQDFINALTTNTTEFFREEKHFEIFRSLLEKGIEKRIYSPSRDLRIWCAAASTGQEPYSILMTVLETIPNWAVWNIRFLATDINFKVLDRAARGEYSSQEIKKVPPFYRQKYFNSEKTENGVIYGVKPEIKNKIRFAPLNLLNFPYPFQHRFDFIFCRNVLIYFERDSVLKVVETMGKGLNPHGYLFLGHAETGVNNPGQLRALGNAVYEKIGG